MSNAVRAVLVLALVAALAATWNRLRKEQRPTDAPAEIAAADRLMVRIQSLPVTPRDWELLESAPAELNDPNVPDFEPRVISVIEKAQDRITLESYTLHRSWGAPGRALLKALKRDVRVLGVVHPNPMNDPDFIEDLRALGANLVERDLAPLGGNPEHGYVHAKFVVADGRRGVLGSANLNGAGMRENREMGIAFDDPLIALTLEMMTSLDAGNIASSLSADIKSAVLLQGAADGFAVKNMPLCEQGVEALCRMAKKNIDVMMFTFSHAFGRYDAIVRPLRGAVRRGVKVRLIHDAGTVEELDGVRPTLRDMKQWGVDVRTADIARLGKQPYGQYHAKAFQVDGEFLMVGSNNWTEAATHENREIALILRSTVLADRFLTCFNTDWNSGHAKPFLR
ncbi:hypothetical protein HY522_03185 [bacterium]|nr:hypothetical protein [bacterium]